MSASFRRLSLSLLILSPLASVAHSRAEFDLAKTTSILSELIELRRQEEGIASISIALVKDDAIVWKAAFGFANVRMKIPATPDTIYSTGSTFKCVTAAAILKLVENGEFALKDPVNQYLGAHSIRDRQQSDVPVNFIHMLSHWSGLNTDVVEKPIWGRELPPSLEQLVSGLHSIRAPETQWEYNNAAYGLAGYLIERVSGVEYETFVVENILKPLGVEITRPVRPSPDMVERMALPYEPGGVGGSPIPVAQIHYDVYPAGDVYLTAEDMARFVGALVNRGSFQGRHVLTEESVAEMRTARFGGNYGLGLGVSTGESGHTIIDHLGGIPGQTAILMGDVDAHVGVYIMSNSGAPSEIALAAIRLLRGEDYTLPPPRKLVALDVATLDRYVGTYELNAEAVFEITRKERTLSIRKEGEENTEVLLAESETRFLMKNQSDFAVTFLTNDEETVEAMEIAVEGRRLLAKRKRP